MTFHRAFGLLGLAQPPEKLTRGVPIPILREGLWLMGYDVEMESYEWNDELIDALKMYAKDEGVSITIAPVEDFWSDNLTQTINITPASLVDKIESVRLEAKDGKTLYDLAATVELAHRNAPVFKARVQHMLDSGVMDDWTLGMYERWVAEADAAQERLKEIIDDDWETFLSAAEALRVDPQMMRELLETPVTRVGDGKSEEQATKAVPMWAIILAVVAFLTAVVLVWDDLRKVITHVVRTGQLIAILAAGAVGVIPREEIPALIEPVVNPPPAVEEPDAGEPSLFDRVWDVAKPWVELGVVVGIGAVALWWLKGKKGGGESPVSTPHVPGRVGVRPHKPAPHRSYSRRGKKE